jgi:hypothetical protein
MDPDCWVQAYVHKKLEELLLNHGRKYPLVKIIILLTSESLS